MALKTTTRTTRWTIDGISFVSTVSATYDKETVGTVEPTPTPVPEPTPVPTTGTVYLVDPIGGSGNYKDVWAAVAAGAKGGDTILLRDGSHGHLEIKGTQMAFDKDLVIRAQNPYKAHVTSIMCSYGAKNISFEDLDIYYTAATKPEALAYVQASASHISFRRNRFRSIPDVSGFLSWSATEWLSKSAAGIVNIGSVGGVTEGNHLNVVSFGINVPEGGVARNNIIENFCGDALRGASKSLLEGNTIRGAFQVDGNHADGIQAFAGPTGVLSDLVIRGNTINNWHHSNLSHPLRANLQGIGLYDGWYDNLIIDNNNVTVHHWHGISVYGGRNSKITNNVVTKLPIASDIKPWIAFFDHKTGGVGSNNVMTDNTAPQFTYRSGVILDTGNIVK